MWFFLVVQEQYGDQKLCIGARAVSRFVTSPRLKRFKILSEDTVMASLSKDHVKIDGLQFTGTIIMQKSE